MSVSTPILTTSSEIWAFAAPLEAAKARPAVSTAANDFMFLLPMFLSEVFVPGPSLAAFGDARKADFLGIGIAALTARAAGGRKLREIFAVYRLERLGLLELLQ